MTATDAVVVGAGPNGLAAAIAIAQEGFGVTVLEAADTIGGGARTAELTEPGLLHDVCSAVHPFAVSSPFLGSLPLEEHGLVWRHPEIPMAHPLDDGTASILYRSLDATADALGPEDGSRWRRLFGPTTARWDVLPQEVLRPLLRLPRRPLLMARFGALSLLPASVLGRVFRGRHARALLAGLAAHASQPLTRPTTSAFALTLAAAGHTRGWPVAEGGSQAIPDAMASYLRLLGGSIETGTRVASLEQLPSHRVALLDVTPRQLLAIAGHRMPRSTARRYQRFRYGTAAFKLDLAVEGAIPWTAEPCRAAGTVHVGGTFEEVADAEKDVAEGRMPERPFVLVGQQSLADPSRASGDLHPVWAYAHVPNGFDGDATAPIELQIERFAPGFRDRIRARHVMTPIDLERYNENYVGGDIAGGAHDPLQLIARPILRADPYATGVPGLYLCSASTPPGGGVHGMCGANAAESALEALRA